MLAGIVIKIAVGAVCIALGLVLWFKRKVTILHENQYKNVKEEDIPAFARMIGIGLCVVGAGIITSGILDFFFPKFWWISFTAGFVVGLAIMYIAEVKYNGSVLG